MFHGLPSSASCYLPLNWNLPVAIYLDLHWFNSYSFSTRPFRVTFWTIFHLWVVHCLDPETPLTSPMDPLLTQMGIISPRISRYYFSILTTLQMMFDLITYSYSTESWSWPLLQYQYLTDLPRSNRTWLESPFELMHFRTSSWQFFQMAVDMVIS